MMQSTISTLPPYLSLSIWVPIICGVLILALGRDSKAGFTRWLSLAGAVLSMLCTLPLIQHFDNAAHGMQFVEKAPWIETFNIWYSLGIDGLSLWFVPLTAFITVIVVISAWQVIEKRIAQYMEISATEIQIVFHVTLVQQYPGTGEVGRKPDSGDTHHRQTGNRWRGQ